jgi:putative ABC transport system permease protein
VDGLLVQTEEQVLNPGAWLAGLLAVASVAVLAGGRMTEASRRVGLLKAVGGTPGLVTAVLLARNLVVALAAAGTGLAAGWLAAPLLTSPGAALVGTPGPPAFSGLAAGVVVAAALAVALAATLVPAVRAARTSIPARIGARHPVADVLQAEHT